MSWTSTSLTVICTESEGARVLETLGNDEFECDPESDPLNILNEGTFLEARFRGSNVYWVLNRLIRRQGLQHLDHLTKGFDNSDRSSPYMSMLQPGEAALAVAALDSFLASALNDPKLVIDECGRLIFASDTQQIRELASKAPRSLDDAYADYKKMDSDWNDIGLFFAFLYAHRATLIEASQRQQCALYVAWL